MLVASALWIRTGFHANPDRAFTSVRLQFRVRIKGFDEQGCITSLLEKIHTFFYNLQLFLQEFLCLLKLLHLPPLRFHCGEGRRDFVATLALTVRRSCDSAWSHPYVLLFSSFFSRATMCSVARTTRPSSCTCTTSSPPYGSSSPSPSIPSSTFCSSSSHSQRKLLYFYI